MDKTQAIKLTKFLNENKVAKSDSHLDEEN